MQHSYLFIVGGVMSGVGKGTSSAALALTLKAKGYSITMMKIDPYVNVDAGTMNPLEHGEVFVTIDGDETDQDIGTYERFLNENITRLNYMTTGRVYRSVIERERNLEYGGKCVEVVPHVPEEIIRRIKTAAEHAQADITIIEVGGTVGEYQNILFLEAARMMQGELGRDRVQFVLVSYLPVPRSIGEMKTKPTQYAVRELNGTGILPNFIVGRSELPVDKPRKEKIAQFCAVPSEHIISAPDVKSIYDIPDIFEGQEFAMKILHSFGLMPHGNKLDEWNDFTAKIRSAQKEIHVGVVGKYFSTGDFVLSDVYLSVLEAIKHAGASVGVKPVIEWLNAEEFEQNPAKLETLKDLQAIVVPGGFGSRGIEGKIKVIEFARTNNIPYLGLCYGMQLAVIEFARNVLGWTDANTTEIDKNTGHPVIDFLPGQNENVEHGNYGGTLRLGSYDCLLAPGTKSIEAYGRTTISERHRHRYEFNNVFRTELEQAGLIIAGTSPDGSLVEMIEHKNHPFFVGVQFHPEFQSRPLSPHPLFVALLKAGE
ncbi:MAG: CTP synthase [Patescibacteria group bacterium]|jgi:CTP synthase